MIPLIILILSIILDGILTNFLPYIELSLFTPLLTLVSIFLIYPFYKKTELRYFVTLIILGILYDLFYTNLLFFNAILFLIIGFITKIIYKNLDINFIKLIIYIIGIIIIYELTTGLIIFIFNLVPITITKILYKITHSILLNVIYAELIYLVLKIIPKKFKKININ